MKMDLEPRALVLLVVGGLLVISAVGFFTITATQGFGAGSCSWRIEWGLTADELQKGGVCPTSTGTFQATYYINFANPQGAIAITTGKTTKTLSCAGQTLGYTINRYGPGYDQKSSSAGKWIAKFYAQTPTASFLQEAAYNVPASCLASIPTITQITPSPTVLPPEDVSVSEDGGIAGEESQEGINQPNEEEDGFLTDSPTATPTPCPSGLRNETSGECIEGGKPFSLTTDQLIFVILAIIIVTVLWKMLV